MCCRWYGDGKLLSEACNSLVTAYKALWYLGLDDCVDVVYGSSAGSLVGAYFITKQLPYGGPEIYYKLLTSAGKRFIDTKYILRSCGLGLLDLRLSNILNLATDR